MSDNGGAWAAIKPFATGSMSGSFATVCIQPMDMVKVRIQVAAAEGGATGPISIASQMIRNEGFFALYNGLSAGITRQIVYTGTRLGLYDILTEKVKTPGEPMPLYKTAACGLTAGGIAAVVGNPADLSLIRMQTDSMLPEAERRGYKHAGDALLSIVKGEGFLGLFKGALPTAVRAMGLNLGMLSGNTVAKDVLHNAGVEKGTGLNTFGASCVAGFFASFFSLPFDFVKTQVQKQKPDANGVLPYKGPLDCAAKMLAKGGPLTFYAGFPTYYFRIAPHAMITLLAQNEVKKFWKKMDL